MLVLLRLLTAAADAETTTELFIVLDAARLQVGWHDYMAKYLQKSPNFLYIFSHN